MSEPLTPSGRAFVSAWRDAYPEFAATVAAIENEARALHPVSDATPDLAAALNWLAWALPVALRESVLRRGNADEARWIGVGGDGMDADHVLAGTLMVTLRALASEPVPATGNPEGIDDHEISTVLHSPTGSRPPICKTCGERVRPDQHENRWLHVARQPKGEREP